MGLINFLEDAGEKLFGKPSSASAQPQPSAGASQPSVEALNASAGAAIAKYIFSQGLSAQNLEVKYDGATKTVTVRGIAPDQATKEKIVLCCGNVASVAKVDDQLTAAAAASPAPAASFHQVKSGDTLSKIAKEVYGNANEYPKIFEANRPMLSSPDRIYPGQMLRIPK
jgi:nucleoid-associated protein YgaU